MGELVLRQGDYVPDGAGGFAAVEGDEALLQRVLFKLTARRGAFPLLPELGSRLYLLPRQKPGERESQARLSVTQALADEADLEVTGVTLAQGEGGRGTLRVELRRKGAPLAVTVEV